MYRGKLIVVAICDFLYIPVKWNENATITIICITVNNTVGPKFDWVL